MELLKEYLEDKLNKIGEQSIVPKRVKRALEGTGDFIHQELEDSGIDLEFSGTTLVLALVIKKYLYFLNIGDSRAVLASKVKGRLKESLATKDHNPENLKERKRIESMNGRVSPIIDEYGKPYGPYRVWNQEITEPGLAMSRSLGDSRAHELGVSFQPGKYFL